MNKNAQRPRGSGRLLVLGVVFGIALGSVGVLLTRPDPVPGWLQPDTPEVTVRVTSQGFTDERSIPVTATMAPEWVAPTPMSGVLRRTSCKIGKALESGKAPFVVDGDPIILLHMASPPYRDFEQGIKGDDVVALQKELARLGFYKGPKDGYFGWTTAQGVAKLWDSVGVTGEAVYRLPISHVLWIPRTKVTPASCPMELGVKLVQGDPLFTTGGGLALLQAKLPTNMISGTRSIILGDTKIPLSEDGRITDQKYLAAYMKSPRYVTYLKDNTLQLTITVFLDQPITSWAVPASALYSIVGADACLLSDGQPVKARIVASQFGSTLVSVDGVLGAVVVNPAEDSTPCG